MGGFPNSRCAFGAIKPKMAGFGDEIGDGDFLP